MLIALVAFLVPVFAGVFEDFGGDVAVTPMSTTTVHDASRRPVSAAVDQPSWPFVTCSSPTVPQRSATTSWLWIVSRLTCRA